MEAQPAAADGAAADAAAAAAAAAADKPAKQTGPVARIFGRLAGVATAAVDAQEIKARVGGAASSQESPAASPAASPQPKSRAAPEKPLPEGWELKTSTSTGKVYYRNMLSGKTQWQRPRAAAQLPIGR